MSKEYLQVYNQFSQTLNSVTKTVTIRVETQDLINLKKDKYRLCFAKKVGNVYTVVWQSYKNFSNSNVFSWIPQYQLFATNRFQEGIMVNITTYPVTIGLNETSILDEYGSLGPAKTGGSSTAITMMNDYGRIHPGVNQLSTGPDGTMVSTPIYVAEFAAAKGKVELTPKEQIMVWFEQDIETSTMISSARSRFTEIDLTLENEKSITYKDEEWIKA